MTTKTRSYLALLTGVFAVNAQSLDLAGIWHIAPSTDSSWESAKVAPADSAAWQQVTLPDWRWSGQEPVRGLQDPLDAGPCVWARRSIMLTPEQAKQSAVLSWEMIRWMLDASVNGTPIGTTDHFGPGRLLIKSGLLRAGANELLLKVRNWNSLTRGGSADWPLVPSGVAIFGWSSRESGILGDISLDLFDDATIRSVMMLPQPADSSVTAVVRLFAAGPVRDSARIAITVTDASGAEIGKATRSLMAGKLSDTPISIKVKLSRFDLWSPQSPSMTHAKATLTAGPESHTRDVSFGMRSFEARDGHFFLNDKPYTILGSNIIAPWLSGSTYHDNGALKKGLIDAPRGMNVAVLRTHSLPPLRLAADLCDTTGMLLLAEMPFTYNYQNSGFDQTEARRYHETGKRMTLAWMEELANHPSIIMWVSTNEPPATVGEFDQTTWDFGEMIPAMKQLDPSRPVLRAGQESPDVQDIHCYDGYWGGASGDYNEEVTWRAASSDGKRPVMNSEYIENMNAERAHRWLGVSETSDEARLFYAMVGMKQTEVLRRLGYDGMLPYGMYGWARGNWRPYAPSPIYAALRNALSPLAVSVDIDDRNFVAGDSLRVDVWLINDLNDTVPAQLACYVCAKNPDFWPKSPELTSVRSILTQAVRLGPRSRRQVKVAFPLPKSAGTCWLAAVITPDSGQAVISQREVALWPANKVPAAATKRIYRVIGANDTALGWFKQHGIRVQSGIPYGRWQPDADMLIVWEGQTYSKRNLHVTDAINTFLKAGRRVLIMQQHGWRPTDWHWGALGLPEGPNPEYTVLPQRCGLALREKVAGDEAIWNGLDRQSIMGWNGLNNAVCRDALATLPAFDQVPGRRSSAGQVPLLTESIVIEGESAVSNNFVVDFHDPLHTMQNNGKLVAREFSRLRGGKASLLSTRTPPADAYSAKYEFTAPKAMNGVVWVFEQGRPWASPFSWRIDDGAWALASTDVPAENPEKMAGDGPTFAWSRLGGVKLKPGKHSLEVRVTAAKNNGHFLLSQDCFMVAPAMPPAEVLAKSGDGGPVLARVKYGRGELLITQLLLGERLSKQSVRYDPVAEKLMLNMMSY